MENKIVVGYMRVSTEEQEDSQAGMLAQRAHVESYCEKNGLEIDRWFHDVCSGATPIEDRDGLIQAFEHGDIVVAQRRDRFSRSLQCSVGLDIFCRKLEVELRTADGVPFDDDPVSELIRNLLDSVAQFERKIIVDRIRRAMAAKRKRGEYLGAVPYGFRLEGEHLVKEPKEQQILAYIKHLSNHGLTPGQIARRLDKSSHKPRGVKWHQSTVTRILQRLDSGD